MSRVPASKASPMRQWWRIGGAAGILWAILFIVGAIVLSGDTPSRDDSVAEVREFFSEDGDTYLLGDYLLGLGFVLGFIPFFVVLASLVAVGEGWPSILSRLIIVTGTVTTVIGAVAGIFWGALALGVAENAEVDDSSIRTLMELDVYAFATLGLAIGIFALACGLGVWFTGVVWRWLGILGIVAGLLSIIGAAWTIDGDEEGFIAIIGFIGQPLTLLFVLITSIHMLIQTERREVIVYGHVDAIVVKE